MTPADDDYSGTDADRPEWKALIKDARQGKFQIVLAKTQSRFMRDIESMEYILHNKFPEWGIRFISLVDQMDTAREGNKKARQITGLMNDWYVEDLSDNLRAVLKAKKKQGKFVGAFAPFGYSKDPNDKNKLIIDEEAAVIVKRIYQMYLSGMGNTVIARELNEEGIPSPTAYKHLKGSTFKKAGKKEIFSCWRDSTVSLILRTQTYAGDMVQHKNTTVSYKNQKKIARPREEWIIVENTHEPIIDRETFNKVRELSKTRTRPQASGKKHIFAGKVRCGYCDSALIKNGTWGEHSYLRCKVANSDKKTCEKGAAIPYTLLYEIVLDEMKKIIKRYADVEAICGMIEESGGTAERQKELLRDKNRMEKQMSDIEKATSNLYIDKIKEAITEPQFLNFSNRLKTEQMRTKQQIDEIMKQLQGLQKEEKEANSKEETVREYINRAELSREAIHEFIDYITVKNLDGKKGQMKKEVNIYWNF